MKTSFVGSALLAVTMCLPSIYAQGGRPSGRGSGRGPGLAGGRSAGAAIRPATESAVTATIQVLARADVQRELELSAAQIAQLGQIAREASAQNSSENAVRSRVLGVLNEAQAARLTELLIQYMGYGSLVFADVRAKLELSSEQQSAMNQIIATAKQAKAGSSTTNQAALNRQLASVLTAAQDAALRKMAGKPLGK